MKRAVICFTRVPRAGLTKTRLLPLLSPQQCELLHRAFLQDLSEVYRRLDADLFVAYTEDPDWAQLQEIFPDAAAFFPQEGAELGARMDHAICRVLEQGYDAVVLTGSDLPLLEPRHLESGFAALADANVVLGPTADGGYYLVGTGRPCAEIFAQQQYGCDSVWDSTVSAARAAGCTVASAQACDDVDTPQDLRRLAELVRPHSHTGQMITALREAGVAL